MKLLVFLFAVGLAKSTREVSDEDFENLVKQVQLLEATVEGLEDQNASTIKQIADLESAVENHEEKIEKLEGQVKALEAENENLNEKVDRLEVSFLSTSHSPRYTAQNSILKFQESPSCSLSGRHTVTVYFRRMCLVP